MDAIQSVRLASRPRTVTPEVVFVISKVWDAPTEQLTARLPFSVCGSVICDGGTDGPEPQYVLTRLRSARARRRRGRGCRRRSSGRSGRPGCRRGRRRDVEAAQRLVAPRPQQRRLLDHAAEVGLVGRRGRRDLGREDGRHARDAQQEPDPHAAQRLTHRRSRHELTHHRGDLVGEALDLVGVVGHQDERADAVIRVELGEVAGLEARVDVVEAGGSCAGRGPPPRRRRRSARSARRAPRAARRPG